MKSSVRKWKPWNEQIPSIDASVVSYHVSIIDLHHFYSTSYDCSHLNLCWNLQSNLEYLSKAIRYSFWDILIILVISEWFQDREQGVRFQVSEGVDEDSICRDEPEKLRLHRRDTPHHLKNKRINSQVMRQLDIFHLFQNHSSLYFVH